MRSHLGIPMRPAIDVALLGFHPSSNLCRLVVSKLFRLSPERLAVYYNLRASFVLATTRVCGSLLHVWIVESVF